MRISDWSSDVCSSDLLNDVGSSASVGAQWLSSRQVANNAKVSIDLLVDAIDGSDNPVLHMRLTENRRYPYRLLARHSDSASAFIPPLPLAFLGRASLRFKKSRPGMGFRRSEAHTSQL